MGGLSVEENLWLACRECNSHKAKKTQAFDRLTEKSVTIFNPRTQIWQEHFKFNEDFSEIIGKTACGRATVEALKMNSIYQKTARLAWRETGKFPPKY